MVYLVVNILVPYMRQQKSPQEQAVQYLLLRTFLLRGLAYSVTRLRAVACSLAAAASSGRPISS
jgi:hypothetical protein